MERWTDDPNQHDTPREPLAAAGVDLVRRRQRFCSDGVGSTCVYCGGVTLATQVRSLRRLCYAILLVQIVTALLICADLLR
jgi:hypothetical protein